ncbi:unnamed protein product, partial [Mesorhabditis belari]|uniref:Potassium channel domain-containing protein n=1 Tax=Mesorhabditis belari TaxID=2138241 RepID=A0AAF3FCL8_9BILA
MSERKIAKIKAQNGNGAAKGPRSKSIEPEKKPGGLRADRPLSVVDGGVFTVVQNVSKSLPNINKGKVKHGDAQGDEKKKKRRRRRKEKAPSIASDTEPPPPDLKAIEAESRSKTFWRHMIWMVVLFVWSVFGGLIFSAIEGGHDRTLLLQEYERKKDLFDKRQSYQEQIFNRFRNIEDDVQNYADRRGLTLDESKMGLVRDALEWYEKKLGIVVEEPVMEDTKWDVFGGIYYSASLYTTIGYGNYYPRTTAGRIVSMIYAFVGIPLVFTILLDWGFLYFTWIEYFWNHMNQKLCQSQMAKEKEKKLRNERVRRVGSELSLRSTSTMPLLSVHTANRELVNNTDHHIESNKPLQELELLLAESEQVKTVPLKSALIFFMMWICFSAGVVRLWEFDWSYFTAFYFFFTSLTTIGLGDVVTKSPKFIMFQLSMTLVGLSVVGLSIAIVQSKVRLVFDRLIRSIDAQYRIKQIDQNVATMSIITDEYEGIKRLCDSQPLQDRLVFIAMDEHKMSMLRERWRQKSRMINRITQTYPSKADKFVQTGNRVYDQPNVGEEGEWESECSYSDEEGSSDESDAGEMDELGRRLPPARKYIYTIFD